MTKWIAVTETGSTYTKTENCIKVTSERRGNFALRGPLQVVDRDSLIGLPADEAWKKIFDSPRSEIPKVGKAIYIHGFSAWNLSTNVVSVEILEEEEDE